MWLQRAYGDGQFLHRRPRHITLGIVDALDVVAGYPRVEVMHVVQAMLPARNCSTLKKPIQPISQHTARTRTTSAKVGPQHAVAQPRSRPARRAGVRRSSRAPAPDQHHEWMQNQPVVDATRHQRARRSVTVTISVRDVTDAAPVEISRRRMVYGTRRLPFAGADDAAYHGIKWLLFAAQVARRHTCSHTGGWDSKPRLCEGSKLQQPLVHHDDWESSRRERECRLGLAARFAAGQFGGRSRAETLTL